MSASGDKTLRFWKYKSGQQVHQIDLAYVPVRIVLSESQPSEGFIAVSSDDNTLYVYSYSVVDSTAVKTCLLGQKTYADDFEFVARRNIFFIKTIDSQRKLLIDKFEDSSFQLLYDVTDVLNLNLEPSFKIFKPFDVLLLFKKKYDNMKLYNDRKRARIDNEEAKRK